MINRMVTKANAIRIGLRYNRYERSSTALNKSCILFIVFKENSLAFLDVDLTDERFR